VSRPAVSQHLRVLKDAGLVIDRAEGNRRLYAVDPNGLNAVRSFLELFWAEALGRFAAASNAAVKARGRA
jgi:DNA-binding transcriptional ArsR family regulator